MPAKVVTLNEIIVDGTYLPLLRPVRRVLSSQYPGKVVIGDSSKDSDPTRSVVAWTDWRGGIGINRLAGETDVDRAWWSTCQLRYKGHLVLPPLATKTAAVSGNTSTIGAIGELGDEIYAAFGTSVRKYNNASDTWGISLATLPAVATDAINVRLGATIYLVFATSGGYTYTSDGAAFTDDTTDTKYMATWNDMLWGIDSGGQLWYALAIGTETNDALLPLPSGYVTDLFVARNAAGDPIIYAMTKAGLFAHDFDNGRFVETELGLPTHPNNGLGSLRWRDAMYVPAGLGIYKYVNGSNSAVISLVGPDRDHGLPAAKRGVIKRLVGSHNELFALVDIVSTGTDLDMLDGAALGSQITATFGVSIASGYPSILGYDELGWQVKWHLTDTQEQVTYGIVSSAYTEYRLWWGSGTGVYYMDLPQDIINPTEVTTFEYGLSGQHETPWFSAGQTEVTKTALSVIIETEDTSSTETIAVSYALNYDEATYVTLGTISAPGKTEYRLPSTATPEGVAFRSIKFKLLLARGSTNTLSPDATSLTLTYRKKLTARWGFTVDVNLNAEHKGNTPKQMRDAIVDAVEGDTLVEFTYRDDDTGEQNYYVDVVSAAGLERTGNDQRGETTLVLAEG